MNAIETLKKLGYSRCKTWNPEEEVYEDKNGCCWLTFFKSGTVEVATEDGRTFFDEEELTAMKERLKELKGEDKYE